MKLNLKWKILISISSFVFYVIAIGLSNYYEKPQVENLMDLFSVYDLVVGVVFIIIVLFSLSRKPKKRF